MPLVTNKFKHGKDSIPMFLGYKLANTKILDLGLDVLSIMKDQNGVIQTIMFDDSLMLKVWFFYITEHNGQSWEEALEILDGTEGGLQQFKDKFWDMLLGFMPLAVQPALKLMKKEVMKHLTNVTEKDLNISSSPSSED